MLQERAKQESQAHQDNLQTCVIVGRAIGAYTVRFGGQEAVAFAAVVDSLKPGDQVQVLFGRGTPMIIGVLGKDGSVG